LRQARKLIRATKKAGLEGIIAKRRDSQYEARERSGAWMKYKADQGQEFVIGGYRPGKYGFEYLLAGYYEGTDLIFVAKIKNGFVPHLRRDIARKFDALQSTICPFANLPNPKMPGVERSAAIRSLNDMSDRRPNVKKGTIEPTSL
jgi:bifunctional non-homologous end joining protein LigD